MRGGVAKENWQTFLAQHMYFIFIEISLCIFEFKMRVLKHTIKKTDYIVCFKTLKIISIVRSIRDYD